MSLNRCALVGRLCADPESRSTNTGKTVVNFTLAVDKRIKSQDPNAPSADFFKIVCWNQTAEFVAQYGGKGRLAAVDGRLETRKFVDKDGNNREMVEVVADNVNLLDKPVSREGTGGGEGYSRPATTKPAPPADEYDPFS